MSLDVSRDKDESEFSRKPAGTFVEIPSDEGPAQMVWKTWEEMQNLHLDSVREAWNGAISERIRKDQLTIEASLFNTKWFDYRFMHPAAATHHFALHYIERYRRQWAIHFDKYEAEKKTGTRLLSVRPETY